MFNSVKDLACHIQQNRPKLSFGTDDFDKIIGKAINSPGIVEIYGPNMSGKTTMAFVILIEFLRKYPSLNALYVKSKPNFSLKRLQQICTAKYDSMLLVDVQKRLILRNNSNKKFRVEVFEKIQKFVENFPVGLIIIDSIASNFRNYEWQRDYVHDLYKISNILNNVCRNKMIPIICINEVKTFNQSHNHSVMRPCLGLAWSNSISTRIEIIPMLKSNSTEGFKNNRRISVKFSPDSDKVNLECEIVLGGMIKV